MAAEGPHTTLPGTHFVASSDDWDDASTWVTL